MKVSPSVEMTTGVVKLVGTVTVLVSHSSSPGKEVTTIPSGRVVVNCGGGTVVDGGSGKNVNVSPSVISVVGVLKPVGITIVLVSHIKSPGDDVIIAPSGKVVVDTPDGGRDVGGGVTASVGSKVNVSPSIVSVTGVVSPTGIVKVTVSQISRPDCEVTTWPSERVVWDNGVVAVSVALLNLESVLTVVLVTTLLSVPEATLVAVSVRVLVAVSVGLAALVLVAVLVSIAVSVLVAVSVSVAVLVPVIVLVFVTVFVSVAVLVPVAVSVSPPIAVVLPIPVLVPVAVPVAVLLPILVAVSVPEGY